MAKYEEVLPGDKDYSILANLDARLTKYIVIWQAVAAAVRTTFGVYRSVGQGFNACRRAKDRNEGGGPLCYLYAFTRYFKVLADNEFTH